MSEISKDDDDERGNFSRKQDEAMLAVGFEYAEDGLWVKDGVLYGREAALQYAFRKKRQEVEGLAPPDRP